MSGGSPSRPGRKGLGLVVIAACMLGGFVTACMKDALRVDACLDAGGRWDMQSETCEGAPG